MTDGSLFRLLFNGLLLVVEVFLGFDLFLRVLILAHRFTPCNLMRKIKVWLDNELPRISKLLCANLRSPPRVLSMSPETPRFAGQRPTQFIKLSLTSSGDMRLPVLSKSLEASSSHMRFSSLRSRLKR